MEKATRRIIGKIRSCHQLKKIINQLNGRGSAVSKRKAEMIETVFGVKEIQFDLSGTNILLEDGMLWSCGANGDGQLGTWESINTVRPKTVVGENGDSFTD